jgi:1-deoxy-D-xylulose-5-phosphate synthase
MVKLAREIPGLIGITAAMLQGTGLEAFAANFPDRFYIVSMMWGSPSSTPSTLRPD